MIELKTRLRKWGNSLGIIVPQKIAGKESIKEGDEVVVIFKKEEDGNILKEMFGTFKFKKSAEKIMKEADKELWDL